VVGGPTELRLAVVSPFLDRLHGTERCIVEQLERLAARDDMEIHIYSQRIEDLNGVSRYPACAPSSRILWHKVPAIPGPHLSAYLWWFIANHLQRFWDSRIRGIKFDLLYSPGINALDADVIAVHIVFHEFYKQVRGHLSFGEAAPTRWPRLLHRLVYYHLIMALERLVYRRPAVSLSSVSGLVASQLAEYFQRSDVVVIPNSVDTTRFSCSRRKELRISARDRFRVSSSDFALLLIGNDWKKKGLDCLLAASAACRELSLTLLVVGSDRRAEYEAMVGNLGLAEERVLFLDAAPDVMQFYAAADAYVGPSLEDAYGLPILEAMACGLPVIASSRAGVSEIITHRKNAMILHDPQDAGELAALLRELCANPRFCEQIGREAALAAAEQTWDRNAASVWDLLNQAATKKRRLATRQENR
jgi:glycosyltransferase involved in cell wall biosynthesis